MSRRLKSLASLVVDQTDRGELPYLALEHIEGGTGALVSDVELPSRRGGEPGTSAVQQGDVLFGKLRPYLAKTLLVSEPAYASTELMALRADSAVDARYLAYLVGSRPLIEWATASSDGTKMPRTSWEKLGEFRVDRLPTSADQRAIADYLDTETARIDALIAKKQRMIELLGEHLSVAAQSATLGLEPDNSAEHCPDGVSSRIPSRWAKVPLHTVCSFQSGKAHEPFIEDDAEYICVNSRFVSTEGQVVKRCTQNLSPARRSDILMVMSDLPNGRALAKAFFVENDDVYAVNQRVCIIRPHGLHPKFAFYQLNRHPYFMKHDDGSNQTHLANSVFTKFPFLLPPLEQQVSIAAFLDRLSEAVGSAAEKLRVQVQLLQERRQALITAAVTGELEIPGLAA